MKPIHTLTWAVSAPILLFAGASHAINVSDLLDPACTGTFKFDSVANKIMCDTNVVAPPACSVSAPATAVTGTPITIEAICNPAATSYNWTATSGATPSGKSYPMTFTTAGDYSYTVQGINTAGTGEVSASKKITVTLSGGGGGGVSACRDGYVVPAGTNILEIGAIDYYAKVNFDSVFDSAGSTFSSVVGSTEIKALKFDTSFVWGFVSLLQGTQGGSGYKDISISTCPGDFDASLGVACLRQVVSSTNLYYSTDGLNKGCKIPVGTPIYLNVRATPGKSGSGFLLQNVDKTP